MDPRGPCSFHKPTFHILFPVCLSDFAPTPCPPLLLLFQKVLGFDAIDLVPGGVDKDVTMDNVEEYIDLMTDFSLNAGIKRQLDAFKGQSLST